MYSDKLPSAKGVNLNPLYTRLSESNFYISSLKERYNYLRKDIITSEKINSIIDANYKVLKSAWRRNFEAFPVTGLTSFENEVRFIKKFLVARLIYLDSYINNPPSITIGSTPARIYDQADIIFCALPHGSKPLQIINYDFGPDAKVYLEAKSYGTTNIYGNDAAYKDFLNYEKILHDPNNRDDGIKFYIDYPRSNIKINGNVQIGGWAIDPGNKVDSGIISIFVFDGPNIGKDAFIGKAEIGFSRKDVADYFKKTYYENSGFLIDFNSLNLKNGNHDFYIYFFGKNNNYSLGILPEEINNENNIPVKLENRERLQLFSNQEFDFKDFIYHGILTVEKDGTSKKFDLWVTTGNLPIMYINTNNININNDYKISGSANVISNNSIEEYKNITIKIRGQSAQMFPKKQYSMEINDYAGKDREVPLLGLPKESDWVLYAPYSDKTLMRNAIAFELANQMGYYAPRTKYFELFLDEGDTRVAEEGYNGLYVLIEKIKKDNNRVNIKENNSVNANEGQTGFILEMTQWGRVQKDELHIITDHDTYYLFRYPNQNDLTDEQKEWIKNYMNEFEDALYGSNFKDPIKGYRKYIDVDSFIDYILIIELFKNVDGFGYSTFLNKDIDGKLKAGPIWDLDWSSGNNKWKNIDGWLYINNEWAEMSNMLFKDDYFVNKYVSRWKELRKNILSNENIIKLINMNENFVSEGSESRNFKKWQILEVSIFPHQEPIPKSYQDEIESLKQWFIQRTNWIDKNIDSLINTPRY
jgi:hypothetical protein